MLVIRLARVGRKNQASFRLVAAEKLRTPTGKFVARLGHYDPHTKEFVVDKAKLEHYFSNGAQPSSTVVKLLKRNKIAVPKWAEGNLEVRKRAPKPKKNDTGEEASLTTEADTAKNEESTAPEDKVAAEADKETDKKEDEAKKPPTEEPPTSKDATKEIAKQPIAEKSGKEVEADEKQKDPETKTNN